MTGYKKQYNNSQQEQQELQDGTKIEVQIEVKVEVQIEVKFLPNTIIVSILRLYLNVCMFILTGLQLKIKSL